jgi:hypothetical protein
VVEAPLVLFLEIVEAKVKVEMSLPADDDRGDGLFLNRLLFFLDSNMSDSFIHSQSLYSLLK